jgi:hypothetical protein
MKKIISRFLVFFLVFQYIPLINTQSIHAIDWDGTSDLDLSITTSLKSSSIIWNNFSFNFSLFNSNTSEDAAYKNSFILSLQNGVEFVSSSSLGNPERTLSYTSGAFSWTTLYFFETEDFLTQWGSNSYSVNLRSTNSATLLTDYDVEVLAYANDNIYGRGAVSTWAPGGTLPGWVDLASGI